MTVGTEERLAVRQIRYGPHQVRIGGVLQHEPARTRLQRLRDVHLVGVHADDEDANLGQPSHDLPSGVDPVEPRHRDVQDGDMRLELQRSAHGFGAVTGFSHDLPPGLLLEHASQTLTEQRVIVRDARCGPCSPLASFPGQCRRSVLPMWSPECSPRADATGSSIVKRVPLPAWVSSRNGPSQSRDPLAHADQPNPAARLRAVQLVQDPFPFRRPPP